MSEPRLYEEYERREIIDLFGSEEEAKCLCDAQWVVFSGAVLCFAVVGDPPRHSHFRTSSSFCWVASKPYRVDTDEHITFVPREARQGSVAGRPIHLFVRKEDSGRYVYVGELANPCRFTLGGKDNCGEAYFDLRPALASDVWIALGGLRPGKLDPVSLDEALARLHHGVNVEERFWVLRQLVGYWHDPIRPEDGFSARELEAFTIPYPLRWWYRWAGRRTGIMCGQNFLLNPDRLTIEDGLLRFYVENQCCYQWATHPEGDDPPVFGREASSDSWEPEGITLSEHLILACLFEAIMCHSPYGAATVGAEDLDRIIAHIPPIALNPWRWAGLTRFYAKDGAFMYTMQEDESVWIGARTEHPLQFLKLLIDGRWDYVAV
jgi:hypothetical protein